jgi:hypothetical protein
MIDFVEMNGHCSFGCFGGKAFINWYGMTCVVDIMVDVGDCPQLEL